jgi:hypothetical protein
MGAGCLARRIIVAATFSLMAITSAAGRSQSGQAEVSMGNHEQRIESSPDLSIFLADIRVAFIGRVDEIEPAIVTTTHGNQQVFTRARFEIVELLKGEHLEDSRSIDVWHYAGFYVDSPEGPRATRASTLFGQLRRGDICFVAAITRDDDPGRYSLAGDDTLGCIKDGRVVPIGGNSTWINAVIAHGRELSTTPGVVDDEATAFFRALRRGIGAAK